MFALSIFCALTVGCGSAPLAPGGDWDDPEPNNSDDDDDDDDARGPTWTYVQRLFEDQCSRCHTSNSRAELTDLDDYDLGYEMLVGAPSDQLPSMPRVSPGDLDSSYLVHKLRGTQLGVGGEEEAMPPPEDRAPLSEADIELVEAWILAGALKN
jgi:mono/diheme cytochrome c family protein